jgi:hypothetical protein
MGRWGPPGSIALITRAGHDRLKADAAPADRDAVFFGAHVALVSTRHNHGLPRPGDRRAPVGDPAPPRRGGTHGEADHAQCRRLDRRIGGRQYGGPFGKWSARGIFGRR